MNLNGDLKKYMQALGDISDQRPSAEFHHPTEAAWIDFSKNRLGSLERNSLEGHLSDCLPCSTTLTDIQDFFDPPRPGEQDLSEFEAHQQWRELREKINCAESALISTPKRTRLTISRSLMAIAAGLLLTTGTLGLVTYKLWQEKRALQSFIDQHHNQVAAKVGQTTKEKDLQQALNEKQALIQKLNETQTRLNALDQPQINTPISEITVDNTVHTSSATDGKTELTTSLPAQSNFFAVTLKIVSDAYPTYKIEFLDQNNRSVLNQPNLKPDARANQPAAALRPSEHASLTISIPRDSFPAGKYTFRVYGDNGKQATLLESIRWTFK